MCWVGKGKRGWTKDGFAESLALSSANASQNALWVMKLSFLHVCIYIYICCFNMSRLIRREIHK
jgi:hypothetical protein